MQKVKGFVLRYEWLVFLGLFIAILSFLNYLRVTAIDSDLFWTAAGVCLAGEALILQFEKRGENDE